MRPRSTFAVIGMGRFGSSVAKTLYEMGYEVLAIDTNHDRIDNMLPFVTRAVQADSTDEEVLRELDIDRFDVVVVAIGQDIQASILTTLILKDLNVKFLIVKARNSLHGKVLDKVGADKVIFPERDMGNRVAHHLVSPNILDYIELSDQYSIVEIKVNENLIGKNLQQLHIRAKFGCNVIAIKNTDQKGINIAPSAQDQIKPNDVLVIIGDNHDLNRFERAFQI